MIAMVTMIAPLITGGEWVPSMGLGGGEEARVPLHLRATEMRVGVNGGGHRGRRGRQGGERRRVPCDHSGRRGGEVPRGGDVRYGGRCKGDTAALLTTVQPAFVHGCFACICSTAWMPAPRLPSCNDTRAMGTKRRKKRRTRKRKWWIHNGILRGQRHLVRPLVHPPCTGRAPGVGGCVDKSRPRHHHHQRSRITVRRGGQFAARRPCTLTAVTPVGRVA